MRTRRSTLVTGIALLLMTALGQPAASAGTRADAAGSAVAGYTITVYTGNLPNSGTDAHVFVKFFGTLGSSPTMELDNPGDDFERNSADDYFRTLNDVGTVNRICLWRDDSGPWDEWNVAWVRINGRIAPFYGWMPAFKWICRGAS